MFKKKLAVLVAAAMMTLSAGSAFAYTANSELFRVIYSTDAGASTTIVNDLGTIGSILATSGSNTIAGTSFSYATLGGAANASNTNVVYFAKDSNTVGSYKVWVASASAPTTPARGFANFNSSVTTFAPLYTGANTTGLKADYIAKFGNVGKLAGLLNATSYAEYSLASLTTLNLYSFNFASTTPPATTGTATGISIMTNADGSTTITGAPVANTPIPAAFYLMGSGLLGLVGLRRRNKA